MTPGSEPITAGIHYTHTHTHAHTYMIYTYILIICSRSENREKTMNLITKKDKDLLYSGHLDHILTNDQYATNNMEAYLAPV